ncbi:MAG: leucyl/phenylalanyl-tRNA--protein transferase [Granulosicoccus sp.]|nr:leucyl/phenylalanyl-tRNA--protein transferase [Granulosicoccus sp.]
MPIPILSPDDDITAFPPVDKALVEPNGLLMAGGSLSPQRLIAAYRSGIFPWYEEGEPILWWSPDPRCIIWPDNIIIRRSLAKTIRRGHFEVTRNIAFKEVMRRCAVLRPGSTGTWITDSMINAYSKLHLYGVAQSLEVWLDDRLVGGLYGISLGGVFVGESMFSTENDASKVALVNLAQSGDYQLIDCQLETPHLLSMGAETVTRNEYLLLLEKYGDLSSAVFSPERLQLGTGNQSLPDL